MGQALTSFQWQLLAPVAELFCLQHCKNLFICIYQAYRLQKILEPIPKRTKEQKVHPIKSGITRSPGLVFITLSNQNAKIDQDHDHGPRLSKLVR